jgi:hypothetical protein
MKSTLLEIDPQHIANWLARLPYGQPERAAKLLVDVLLVLNEASLKVEQRQQLTTLYDEAVSQLVLVAEKNLALEEISASTGAQALASMTLAALSAVFVNWKICLDGLMAERGWFKREQPRIELLERTLNCALTTLSWAKQTYLPLPRGFWVDCHSLYRLAEKQGWVRNNRGDKADARLLYQQLLLLGLTDTNRLTEDDIRWLRLTLPQLAGKIRLKPLAEVQEPRGVYVADTESDFPPRFMQLVPRGEGVWLWLDLEEVIADLTARIAATVPNDGRTNEAPVADESAELMQKLVQDWTQPQRRRHNRTSANNELTVISQMSGIWYKLNGERWQPMGQMESLASAVRRPPAPPNTMGVVNQSPIGLMLRGQTQGHSLRTGDILLAYQDGSECLGLFFVRWMTLQAGRPEVECGIERISHEARPAEALASITHNTDAFQFGLLLPGEPKLGISERLVMAGRPFSRLREFRLRDESGERLIRLTRVVNQSPYYQVMEFRLSDDF